MNLRTSLLFNPVLLLFPISVSAQRPLEVNKTYQDLQLAKGDTLSYNLSMVKKGIYRFTIDQQGMALAYELISNGKSFMKSRKPEDITGALKSEFIPAATGSYVLKVYRYADPENTNSGKLSVFVGKLSATEAASR